MTSTLSDPASGHRNGRHTVVDYSFHTDWALNESVDPLEDIVTKLLVELGIDPSGQHFEQTPARMARFYREFTRGYDAKPEQILKTFASSKQDLIAVTDIEFQALCPHHLLVYSGRAHVVYVPDGKVVGISKIPRLVQTLAARLVIQEDLAADIADAFMAVVQPKGCAVKISGKHDCVAIRGVKDTSSGMTVVAFRGLFETDPLLVMEFHQITADGLRTCQSAHSETAEMCSAERQQ